MTSRERRTYFERLCGMREAYQHLDALDRAGITPIAVAIAEAELELERIEAEAEADSQMSSDPATSTQHPA